jgi:hypothetical protein
VVANINQIIREELEVILNLKGHVFLGCKLSDDNLASEVTLLGRLEGKQQLAFQLVRERGETDAAQLQLEFGEQEGVKQTAWNNRLAALAASGIVVEANQGKTKRYRPLLEGV